MTWEIGLILAGALVGGFVNGLTGFGTALSAMPFWLNAVPPIVAAQLAAAAGVVGQLQTLPKLWPLISWRAVAPYIVAGLAGVPFGIVLLPVVDAKSFKLGIGCILVAYCAFQLISRDRLRITGGGRVADAAVGFASGFLGGLAGVSGALPTIWASLRGLSKDNKRMLFQSFNFTILAAMLFASAVRGLITWEFARALLISVPATIIGSQLGNRLYARVDGRGFDRIVLGLLLLSGITMIWGNA